MLCLFTQNTWYCLHYYKWGACRETAWREFCGRTVRHCRRAWVCTEGWRRMGSRGQAVGSCLNSGEQIRFSLCLSYFLLCLFFWLSKDEAVPAHCVPNSSTWGYQELCRESMGQITDGSDPHDAGRNWFFCCVLSVEFIRVKRRPLRAGPRPPSWGPAQSQMDRLPETEANSKGLYWNVRVSIAAKHHFWLSSPCLGQDQGWPACGCQYWLMSEVWLSLRTGSALRNSDGTQIQNAMT